jgi:uncharacterized membrane protein YozB (DUF420 family)
VEASAGEGAAQGGVRNLTQRRKPIPHGRYFAPLRETLFYNPFMGPQIILALKIAVSAVTLLLGMSFIALARGNFRLHGRINIAFFVLTALALVALEVIVRVLDPTVFDYFDDTTRQMLSVHLCFALPATLVMAIMLWTGLSRRRDLHLYLAGIFTVLWIGTVVTGVFFLPHQATPVISP